jgi:hypothetical protein
MKHYGSRRGKSYCLRHDRYQCPECGDPKASRAREKRKAPFVTYKEFVRGWRRALAGGLFKDAPEAPPASKRGTSRQRTSGKAKRRP